MGKPNAATRIAKHVNRACFVHYSEEWGLLYVWRGANEIIILSVWTGLIIELLGRGAAMSEAEAQHMIFDHERGMMNRTAEQMKATIPCGPPEETCD